MRVYADRRITWSFARGVIVHAVTKRNGEEGKGRDRERERKKGKRNGDRNDLIRHGWIVSKLRGFDVHVSRAGNIYPDSSFHEASIIRN